MRVRRQPVAVRPVGLVALVVTRQRAAAVLLLITAAFVVQGAVLGCAVQDNRRLARQGQDAHAAICALKNNLRQRVTDAEAFLRDHPEGIPGIPASVIRNSIANSKRSLVALHGLDCKPSR